MADEELHRRVSQLENSLAEGAQRHAQEVETLREEVARLRARLAPLKDKATRATEALIAKEPGTSSKDDTLVRSFEWRIRDFSSRCAGMAKDEAVWSEEFSIMGVPGLQLEFFPRGRDSTHLEGFCALFLWCRAGVRVKYQLRVGDHRSAPDEDEYQSRMGHGHSNFCYLDAHIDDGTDSVLVGIEVLEFQTFEDVQPGLRLVNQGPERLVARESQLLHNWHMDTVEWRIRNIRARASLPRGVALCSPLFSIAGIRDMLLEFYPNGIDAAGDGTDKASFCGFYVRCPPGSSLTLTLFVGKARKGPIKTEFEGGASKGLPAFCSLQEQLQEGVDDLVVGVTVKNLRAEQEELRTTLMLE